MLIAKGEKNTHNKWVLLVGIVYSISFTLPLFDNDGLSRPLGAEFVIDCVTHTMYPFFSIPIALLNVPIWLGLIALFFQQWLCAICCGILALLGGTLAPAGMKLLNSDPDLKFGAGYYVWMMSIGLLILLAGTKLCSENKR